jgi:glycosyltransferase involved in cell wall biosynthesis
MSEIKKIAFIGNSLPRRCGIATFTTDLQESVAQAYPGVETSIFAMTDHEHDYQYPDSVRYQIRDNHPEDYLMAADILNAEAFDVVNLQHEFGIFGGEAGSALLPLLSQLKAPLMTTLHTILSDPSEAQRIVMMRLIEASARLIVMSQKGLEILQRVYGVSQDRISLIPHGIPPFPFAEPDAAKAVHGFSGRSVILTFGLLSPNKGVHVMIEAMPAIIAQMPNVVYVVLGATHPNLVREQGETYRKSLEARVAELGIADHVVFLDQFVDKDTLLSFISMCDVYVTPYLNEAQMTSGTLAYSFGLGKAIVSTPYWHASELLADDMGVLVPFNRSADLASAVGALLVDDEGRLALRKKAYDASRSMTWPRTAEVYMDAFQAATKQPPLRLVSQRPRLPSAFAVYRTPEIKTHCFASMCDDTGLFQHSTYGLPDRHHGYCVDDNARALLVACALAVPGEMPLSSRLTDTFCSFIQHAWNPDTRFFRNFMSFDRRWLEDRGSEDSHGRTLWALGICANSDLDPLRRTWAANLFALAQPSVDRFSSPRALAFTMLGLNAYCAARPDDAEADHACRSYADRLVALLEAVEASGWIWFENGLAYDNARLPQALIATGLRTKNDTYINAGLRSLRWLVALQTSLTGHFRPIGSQGFSRQRMLPAAYDQQPLEATATVAACLAAWAATQSDLWLDELARATSWFTGKNDHMISLVDAETGSCRDGLHPDRPNENRGGESVVSYLLAVLDHRQAVRRLNERSKSAARQNLIA